jgi:DNA-binding Xre family transcriptional regulator
MLMVKTKAVKFYMREAGFLSQPALAEAMGIDGDRLRKIVNNRKGGLSLNMIERLCAALRCQPGDILEHKADP